MRHRDRIREDVIMQRCEPLLPICFCVDTSRSMLRKTGGADRATGEHIGPTRLKLLNECAQRFAAEMFADDDTRYSVEIAIVTFDDTAKVALDFSRVDQSEYERQGNLINNRRLQIPELKAGGSSTAMRAGIECALELIHKCKEDYRAYGVDYFQPWLVLITDGATTDSKEEFEEIKQHVSDLVRDEKLWVYPFAVGTRAGAKALKGISPEQPVLGLEFSNLPKVFYQMSRGAVRVSSYCGTQGPPVIEPYSVIGWAEGMDDVDR